MSEKSSEQLVQLVAPCLLSSEGEREGIRKKIRKLRSKNACIACASMVLIS